MWNDYTSGQLAESLRHSTADPARDTLHPRGLESTEERFTAPACPDFTSVWISREGREGEEIKGRWGAAPRCDGRGEDGKESASRSYDSSHHTPLWIPREQPGNTRASHADRFPNQARQSGHILTQTWHNWARAGTHIETQRPHHRASGRDKRQVMKSNSLDNLARTDSQSCRTDT